MVYEDLDFLKEINDYAKKSGKFNKESIDKLYDSILANFHLNERLMQLHWYIMQIASETELNTVDKLVLNAFFTLLNPRACSLYLFDSNENIVEYACLGKTKEDEVDCIDKLLKEDTSVQKINSSFYDYMRSYPLYKRNGDKLGYIVGYFQGKELPISESSQIFLDIFTVQVGLAVEGVVSQSRLESLAFTDELTGLANKRVLVSKLEEDLIRAYQSTFLGEAHNGVGFILFDVDNFKHYNDNFGHVAGDVVLKKIGEIISNCTVDIGMGARYGGEELCVIVNNSTEEETFALAQKICNEISSTEFEFRKVTVSGGIAHYPTVGKIDVKEFMNLADIALYSSKNTGKNKISKFAISE